MGARGGQDGGLSVRHMGISQAHPEPISLPGFVAPTTLMRHQICGWSPIWCVWCYGGASTQGEVSLPEYLYKTGVISLVKLLALALEYIL